MLHGAMVHLDRTTQCHAFFLPRAQGLFRYSRVYCILRPRVNPFTSTSSKPDFTLRAVLIEKLSSKFFSFFFQEKQEKQEKQETFPKFGNLTEGRIFGRLRIPLFFGGKKKLREKKCGNLDKKSFDKNCPNSKLFPPKTWALVH